jgi:hypothetical protein
MRADVSEATLMLECREEVPPDNAAADLRHITIVVAVKAFNLNCVVGTHCAVLRSVDVLKVQPTRNRKQFLTSAA